MSRIGGLVAIAVLFALGCRPDDATVSIDLCLPDTQASALATFVDPNNVDFYGVRMTAEGPGFQKVETLITQNPLPTTINTPPFPVGNNRVITLEYLTQDLLVRFRGRTPPFNVEDGKSTTTTMVLADMTTPLLLSTGDTQIRTPTTLGHTAVLKNDNSGEVVLFGGGLPSTNFPGSEEIAIYQSFVQDGAKNCHTISLAEATLAQPRLFHASTVLDNGSFFVYGGTPQLFNGPGLLSFLETFDQDWVRQTDNTLPAADGRFAPLLINLPSNRVLSIGGNDADSGATAHRAFFFNPGDPLLTDTAYVSARCLTVAQGKACAIGDGTAEIPSLPTGHLLSSGVVLIAAGGTSFFLLDPDDLKAAQPFQNLPAITTPPNFSHGSARLLPGTDGRDRVLLAGGFNQNNVTEGTLRLIVADGAVANTEEIEFCGATLNTARALPTVTTLTDGSVLICGGSDGGTIYDVCELVVLEEDNTEMRVYSNANQTCLPRLAQTKTNATASLLPDKTILIVGSTDLSNTNTQTHIERYNPPLALDLEILAGTTPACAPAVFVPPNPGPNCPQ